jgi:hypothetical protein
VPAKFCPSVAAGPPPYRNLGDHVVVPLSGCFHYHPDGKATIYNYIQGKQTSDVQPLQTIHPDGTFSFDDSFTQSGQDVCGKPARVVVSEGWYDDTQPGVPQAEPAGVNFTLTCDHP